MGAHIEALENESVPIGQPESTTRRSSVPFLQNFRFDSRRVDTCFLRQMENAPYQKLLTKTHLFIGVVLTLLVFVLMSYLLRPFTFSPDPLIAQLQASLTAVPITAVFWFAYHMFMVVLVDQKKQKQSAK